MITEPQLEADAMDTEVVLVTGSSGFLGQHVIKLLQAHSVLTREIRTLDVKPFENALDFPTPKPMEHFKGDIRAPASISAAFEGVTTVIHTAGVVNFSVFPDLELLNNVNVKGTKHVIDACLRHHVKRLIYTSTVDVVVGYDDIIDADEAILPPKHFLYKGYAQSKLKAEKLVLDANGADNDNECGPFRTLVLRPTVLYGEGDPYYIPHALRMAKLNGGILPRIGDGNALFQQTYVGNAAYAHIVAMDTMFSKPKLGGKVYFITDDTPVQNTFEFLEFFLKSRQCCLSSWHIPYNVTYWSLLLLEKFLKVVRLFYKVNMSTSLGAIANINQNISFSRERARKEIGYHPVYAYNDSVLRSNGYYMSLGD